MLFDIKKVFDKNNINFFLSHGTLLGYVRDNQLIPWDSDVDLGTFEDVGNFKSNKVVDALRDNGFKVNANGDEYRGYSLTILAKDGFCERPYGIKFWRREEKSMTESNFDQAYNRFNLIEVDFLGDKFLVPDRTDELFKIWYGEKWQERGKSMWIYDNDDELIPYENQQMGYRARGVIEMILKCDKNGDIIYPLERVGRTIRSRHYDKE